MNDKTILALATFFVEAGHASLEEGYECNAADMHIGNLAEQFNVDMTGTLDDAEAAVRAALRGTNG